MPQSDLGLELPEMGEADAAGEDTEPSPARRILDAIADDDELALDAALAAYLGEDTIAEED